MHKVCVYGSDGVNWSIDADCKNTINLLKEIPDIKLVNNFIFANTIFFVWYQQAVEYLKILKFFRKRVVVSVTNDIRYHQDDFYKLKDIVDVWVCANKTQQLFISQQGLKTYLHPYYVNENKFKSLNISKDKICRILDINYKNIKNKFLIGSFQRDSIGGNLNKPKWQKGPELLVDILSSFNKNNILLILAGPRRHWIIEAAKKQSIPYIFVGKNLKGKDDLFENNLDSEIINYLYNLCDLYIVSSKSEGGPKAIIESSLCKLPVISTDVGFAKELLISESIYNNKKEAVKILKDIVYDQNKINKISILNYKKVLEINNKDSAINRLYEIIFLS